MTDHTRGFGDAVGVRPEPTLLEAQMEAAIDGILIVSPDDRVLHWNRRFVEIWDVPEEVLSQGDRRLVVDRQAAVASDPESYRRIAGALFDDPGTSQRDEIALRDGRVIDRWTAPVRARDGSLLGRVLYYRDITYEKQAEHRLRETERWSSFLAEVSGVMSQSLDYNDNLGRLAKMIVPDLADWCAVHVVEEGIVRPVALEHVDPHTLDRGRRLQSLFPVDHVSGAGVAAVVRSQASVLIEEISDALLESSIPDKEHLDQIRSLGLRSAMIVPLVCRDRAVGALTMLTAESGRRYTREDLRMAEDLATRAAFPIDNARLYEERALVARTLQKSLLPPQLPSLPGVEIAARYRPVAEGAEVGGDFYDIFPAGRGSWGIALGDVSGKGVEAATVTSLARHTLRAATMATQHPRDILAMLNAALIEQTEPDVFCTVVYTLVEPRFGHVHITAACGGHPLPYVARSDGRLETVECEGTLLGVVPDPDLVDVSIELEFGDKLILYTDGILDVGPREDLVDQGEIEALFADCSKRGVKAAADLIERTVIERQGGHARDDFALMIMGVRASIFRRARSPRLWGRARTEEPGS